MSEIPPEINNAVSAPDSRSSREAELEQLRQKSLAQQNAQKLAAKPTTPVTLLDWQAQQRAQKDHDRMSKDQTAKMLHNYRGDTDEISSKLSTMKQEDRKNKQEAARLLHNYRGTADGIATKSPKATMGKHEIPDHVDGTVDQRSGEESVAALAAGFNQNGTVQSHVPMQPEEATSSPESAVMVDSPTNAPPEADNPAPTFVVEVKENIAAPPAAMDDDKLGTAEEDWISVESSTVPSPEKIEDMLAVEQKKPGSFDSGEDAITEVADNLDDLDEDDPVMTEAQLHASASGGGHVSLRLDVEFSFALISNDSTPNTAKYMKAVSSIARSLFSENRPAGTRGHAIYNPDFEPFVRLVEGEDSYTGQVAGTRQIIHASLPMFIIDWAEATVTRETVKNVLRNSILDGSLLRLAKEGAMA